ncbi:MAG: hypothetical protein KF892_23725 [Rhizobacter sp.]|nr:hypothetical protein [Rhizobacter sp.]
MRRAILALSVLGFLLFGGSLLLSVVDPMLVERAAREVIKIEVEQRVGERIDSLSNHRITRLAERSLRQNQAEIDRAEAALREDLPRKVANVMADMLNADCECRKRLVLSAHRSQVEELSSLSQIREKLTSLIESTYASVAQSLMREFRIFTAANAVAFGLLGLITVVRRRVGLQLALPSVVLIGAVAITGSLYLFNQNWLHTVIFGQYVGLAYIVYLAGVAFLLADIAFNRARITTQMVNAATSALGSSLAVVPC